MTDTEFSIIANSILDVLDYRDIYCEEMEITQGENLYVEHDLCVRVNVKANVEKMTMTASPHFSVRSYSANPKATLEQAGYDAAQEFSNLLRGAKRIEAQG